MQWAQLANFVLAQISVGALIFVAFFLVVWGAIAISSIKAAAKKPTSGRMTPLPLPPGSRNVRVPPPLPRATMRGVPQMAVRPRAPVEGFGVPTVGRGAPLQRGAKARGVRSGKPQVQAPTAPRGGQMSGGQVASNASGVSSTAVSTSAQVRSAVSSWVNIKTLRSEFLLAEALRPPVALRDEEIRRRGASF